MKHDDANITAAKLAADAVTTAKILDANVTTAKIADANVTTTKIASGGNDKVLTTDGTGVVSWLDKSTFATPDATTLATGKIQLAGDLRGTAAAPAIAAGAVTAAKLASDAVTTAKILDANVTTAKIADANITAAKLAADAVTTAKILDANVTTAKMADANVTTTKIASGGNDKVLTTDGTGVVSQGCWLFHVGSNPRSRAENHHVFYPFGWCRTSAATAMSHTGKRTRTSSAEAERLSHAANKFLAN